MNTQRIRRIIRIMQLLQSGRPVGVDRLIEEFGVSRRTVFRDLNLLESAGIPCAFDRKTNSYSLQRNAVLPPVLLTLEEGLALMLLTRATLGARMLPDQKAAVAAAVKIESALPAAVRGHCGELLKGVDVRWWPMSETGHLADILTVIQQCVIEHRCLNMTYDSFKDGARITVTLRPYRLAFIRRGWYVIGYAERFGEVRTFKVERIDRIREDDSRFAPDPGFSLEGYFGNAWQMIRVEKRYRVRVRFSPKVAGNVEEVLWHKTQVTERLDDDSLLFEVEVDGIEEISWWVLGYGDQAVVLDPPELRAIVTERARRMLEQYGDVPPEKAKA